VEIAKSNKPPKRDVRIFYKTDDMLKPSLLVEHNPAYPDKVAVAAVIAPTFEPKEPQEELEIAEDEEPDALVVDGSDFHFVFVVDRSGSMSGRFMETAKEALRLFIQSLPTGCKYSIISFGNKHEMH